MPQAACLLHLSQLFGDDDDKVRKTEPFQEEKGFVMTQVQKAIEPLSTTSIERMFNQLLSAFSVSEPNRKHSRAHTPTQSTVGQLLGAQEETVLSDPILCVFKSASVHLHNYTLTPTAVFIERSFLLLSYTFVLIRHARHNVFITKDMNLIF